MNWVHLALSPPRYEDETKTRAATLLHFVLISSTIINVVTILAQTLLIHNDFSQFNAQVILLAIQIVLFVMLRQEYIQAASILFCITLWLIIAYLAYANLGVFNPVFAGEVVVILSAGLLINGWAALAAACISSLYSIVLIYEAEYGQYVAQLGPVTARATGINYTAIFIMIALLLFVSLRLLDEIRQQTIRQEQALRTSEARFRSLVENAPDTIATLDRDHRIRYLNRAAIETVEALMGRSVYEFLYPEWKDPYRETLNRVFEQGTTERLEVRALRPEGKFVWSALRFAPIRDEQGKINEVTVISTDITQQREAEEAREISENQYQQLFEASGIPTFVIDFKAEAMISVNEAAVKQYGYSREEFLKISPRELRPPEAAAEIDNRRARIQRGEWTFGTPIPSRHRKKDGTLFYVEIVTNMFNDGHRDLLLFTAQDITERKEADEAIRASEKYFSTVFQSVPVAIDISTVSDGRIINVNRQFLEIMGYKANEVNQSFVADLGIWSPPEQRERFIGEVREKGSVRNAEGYWKTHSGAIRTMLISIEPIRLDGEDCLMVIGLDITERKQAEEAVRRSEALFSKIFQSVPAAISITSYNDGRIIRVNDFQSNLLGYASAEMTNQHSTDLWITPEARTDLIQKIETEGHINNVETKWHTRSGGNLDVLYSAEKIDFDGEDCLLGITVDISELKKVQRERLEAERMRIEVYKEREIIAVRENFISKVSHEFRTPLSIIMGAKESLQYYYDRMTPERRTEHFHNIDQQVQYFTSMLDDILVLSDAHSGNLEFRPKVLNLAATCRKLYEQMQLTDIQSHQFVWSDDGQLGEVRSDPILLQHILINLLSNAMKYSPKGSEIRVDVRREGDDAVLRISDQGIGIPYEDQNQLFHPFYRAANTGMTKGTGLGLAIVKESVDAHGGTVSWESAPGKGTTFIVRLPVGLGK